MALACALEERNCVQAEVDLAARRFRQLVFAAHHQAILAGSLNTRLDAVQQQVAASVRDAIDRHTRSQAGEMPSPSLSGSLPGECDTRFGRQG
jgi:hypothetical protein